MLSTSKYPQQLDVFQVKRNAMFDGDPNGDYVMAEDINVLQDAITAIEETLGSNPQSDKLNVSDRIALLEGSSVLRVPPFLIYLGNPSKINGAKTINEAVAHYLKYDHIVFGNNADVDGDPDHDELIDIISKIKQSRSVKVYGYVDCGDNTSGLTLSEIQVKIQSWRNMGVEGIYCANFGYENNVSRSRQNAILDSIHQDGLVAIVTGVIPEEVLSNAHNEQLNPGQELPNILKGDIYHFDKFAVNTEETEPYLDIETTAMKLKDLYEYRQSLGVRILATPHITTNIEEEDAVKYFEYAHGFALLGSVDYFYPVVEGGGALTNTDRTYQTPAIVGNWYASEPNIIKENGMMTRETVFGKIIIDPVSKEVLYEGIYIPYEVLKIQANSIEGTFIKDASIPDKKIANYNGTRLINAINLSPEESRININKIVPISGEDIVAGSISADRIKTNVIEAINAYIGYAVIAGAKIGDLTADHITAGTINADRIAASVVEAINLKATNAVIDNAKIGNLSADKITAGTIDADRIKASVITAINASIENATIDKAFIGDLTADKITAGDIDAERIMAEVVNAINLYAESAVIDKAKIDSAVIGQLTATHIQAEVINAINAHIGTATIDAAKIGSLTVDNMKANVIEAVNATIGTAKIDQAHIGNLDADKITAGNIDADRLKATVIEAINASIENATIDNAKIGNLDAEKITAGIIHADRIKASVVEAVNLYAKELGAQSAKFDNAVIGSLEAQHIKAAVIEAINISTENAVIGNAKIGELSVNNMKASVIQAVNASLENATIDNAKIGNLSADKIKTGDLDAERIKASVITAVNASIENATINSAKIGALEVDNMKVAVINAINASIETARIGAAKIGELEVGNMKANVIEAVNASLTNAVIESAKIGSLKAENIQAEVIKAVNASIEKATINAAKIGQLEVDNMKANVIEAVNAYIGDAVINSARISDLDASKITAGSINAQQLQANIVEAMNLYAKDMTAESAKIDNAVIGELEAKHISAEVIKAVNASIENAVINSAKIGDLTADKIQAAVIDAINANIGEAKIKAAKIDELTAEHIQAEVLDAIKFWAGKATIDSAVIGELDASKITTGNLSADVMSANSIKAINADLTNATISAAKIGVLSADHITASVIDAINANFENVVIKAAKIDKLTTNHIKGAVVEAINLSATEAKIDAAKISTLSAGHISAEVIEAINGRIDNAVINSAKIGTLTAEHIKGDVVEAINLKATSAVIDSARIGKLTAEHIEAEVIEAINANIGNATIKSAVIEDLNASKITAGDIEADRMKANAITAINADLTNATIKSAKIGALTADKIQAEVIKAVNASIETAKIGAAKIDALTADHIKASVIEAVNISTSTAQIKSAKIEDLNADKITAGDINADRLIANIVKAINADLQTATIKSAKIEDLNADKIVAGDIKAQLMEAEIVKALNLYAEKMTADSAKINSAAIGTLNADHMQTSVIDAVNAYIGTATINAAKIGTLTAEHIKSAVVEAINLKATSAVIDQAKIGDLDASKITTGSLSADVMTTNAIKAINADITEAKIDSAQIGTLKAEHIQTEVIEAINARIDEATIKAAKIDKLTAGHIDAVVINAINASIENAKIKAAHIEALTADHIKGSVVEAINLKATAAVIDGAKIGTLTSDHIKSTVIDAINISTESAKIGYAKIGELKAENIGANQITAQHIKADQIEANHIKTGAVIADKIAADAITAEKIKAGSIQSKHILADSIDGNVIKGNTIHGDKIIGRTIKAEKLEAESITALEISAGAIKARHIEAGAVTADTIRAGAISSQHISTQGLDAQSIEVYNSATGQVLIGGGYVRVDGLDVGVIQSDNLVANGLFLTSSSMYGHLRDNPMGEAVLGSQSKVPGGHEVWKIDLATDQVVSRIDIPAKKPVEVAIDRDGTFGYVTVQGDDTLVQFDARYDTLTGKVLKMGKGVSRIMYTGDLLGDHKHFFVLNTDPTDMAVPDSLMIVDGPPTSVNKELYLHHEVPLGNKPYDIVIDAPPGGVGHSSAMAYITQADQGDIIMFKMGDHDSMKWKVVGHIPITAYATDNYHGGLQGTVGFHNVTGGDSSSLYDSGMGGHAGMQHVHGGYGVPDGPLRKYEPRGIALSSDPEILYTVDAENGELVIVDKNGKAPYNALTGMAFPEGNIGEQNTAPPGMGDSTDYVPEWMGGPFPSSPDDKDDMDPNVPGGDGGHGGHMMSMSSAEEPVFSAKAMSHGGHTMGGQGGGPITRFVWYRIPIGDTPEFIKVVNGKIYITMMGTGDLVIIDEHEITDKLASDRRYYADWDEFEPMSPPIVVNPRRIQLGSKPSHMTFAKETNTLWITMNGQNQLVGIDVTTDTEIKRINVGANPKGLTLTPDGRYMYVVNHGGSGDLSFVYPQGNYIGDAYLGLEGGVEYQGAEYWTPNRSDWEYDENGKIIGSSTVEFRVNEPFLNEGGYTRLSLVGKTNQWAEIQQDIHNAANWSNGNNIAKALKERLKYNGTYTVFNPRNPWLEDPAPSNFTLITEFKDGTSTSVPLDPTKFQIFFGDNPRIEVELGFITEGQFIEVDYTYRNDLYFKPHNGSISVAIENSSSPKFSTLFEIEEFLPKFVTLDNQQTAPFSYYPILNPSRTIGDHTGIEYSIETNRAKGSTVTSSVAPTSGVLASIVDDKEPLSSDEEHHHMMAMSEPVFSVKHDYGEVVTFPGGLQSVTVDLGGTYMIGKIAVQHAFHKLRKYKQTKTEVSVDGKSWTTIYDSAVSGEYMEYTTDTEGVVTYGKVLEFWSNNAKPEERYIEAKPIRYIRDWANGYTEYDKDGKVVATGTVNHWTEIKAFGDWEVETQYVWPDGSVNAGQQIATNGKAVTSTSIPKAWLAIDLPIHFRSWWWMSYLTGPEFGSMDVEMPTEMGGSHSLFCDGPYLNKVAHRHIMPFTPSINIKADPMMGIKKGQHRSIIRQRSGKVAVDRFRFEDFQYYKKSSMLIDPDASVNFRRHKLVARLSQWYEGRGNQSTEGAYDRPRTNPDTGKPDYSVPIKYRFRVRTELNPDTNIPIGERHEERGIAYVTSGIFEAGQLSTHWRRSEASDSFPGNRIEAWDPTQPHKTGIQNFHLAHGAVRGSKIMVNSIMNHHISPYAKIHESKLDLIHPTHGHGHFMMMDMGGMVMPMWMDNKDVLDSIHGWGRSGESNNLAREDHTHDNYLDLTKGGTVVGNVVIQGEVTATKVKGTQWNDVQGKPAAFTPSAHTHTVSDITDLTDKYYTKTEVNNLLSNAGNVDANKVNNFKDTNIFSKSDGAAIKIQPSVKPAQDTILFVVAENTGRSLVTIDSEGDVTIESNLIVKGQTITIGTTEVDGDYTISGNLAVKGNTSLGNDPSDTTTVKGTLRVEGKVVVAGEYKEVYRRPIFGIAGDLQFQMEGETTFQTVVDKVYSLNNSTALPAVTPGATRYYRLYLVYSDDINQTQAAAGQKMTVRIAGGTNKDLDLGSTWGDVNGRRDAYTAYFTDIPTGNVSIQAKFSQTGNKGSIRWIELAAYDYFA